jgi:hypothetical protein
MKLSVVPARFRSPKDPGVGVLQRVAVRVLRENVIRTRACEEHLAVRIVEKAFFVRADPGSRLRKRAKYLLIRIVLEESQSRIRQRNVRKLRNALRLLDTWKSGDGAAA